jgi:hypothetical protein
MAEGQTRPATTEESAAAWGTPDPSDRVSASATPHPYAKTADRRVTDAVPMLFGTSVPEGICSILTEWLCEAHDEGRASASAILCPCGAFAKRTFGGFCSESCAKTSGMDSEGHTGLPLASSVHTAPAVEDGPSAAGVHRSSNASPCPHCGKVPT